ncbi:hypothetical protein AZE42_13218 [Rhizopogon vesiculosus]|uniref:Uncharacterized protein n=1 Tax=Rhizopogon vesiculosus TaxID=180088 RepID=A0A1J8QMZ2_9AGAM|nr:hypothetical protein AZE42_13218 [Rhizopogon vesiculosus]
MFPASKGGSLLLDATSFFPARPGVDPFSNTALLAFQRIARPLFSPFQLGAYIHENQQLQVLRDHCKALEM